MMGTGFESFDLGRNREIEGASDFQIGKAILPVWNIVATLSMRFYDANDFESDARIAPDRKVRDRRARNYPQIRRFRYS